MNFIFTISHGKGRTYKMYLPWHEYDYLQHKLAVSSVPYELDMLTDIVCRMDKKGTFLDIGANIGNHSLFVASYGLDVLSFEPNLELVQILEKSIALNHLSSKIAVFPIGLGASETCGAFNEINLANRGAQSLTLGAGNVPVKAYDSFGIDKNISVIKIDTEGMEYDVLLGLMHTIKKYNPIIYFECNEFNKLIDIFHIMNEREYFYWDTFNSTPTHLFMHKNTISDVHSMQKRLKYFTQSLKNNAIPKHRCLVG